MSSSSPKLKLCLFLPPTNKMSTKKFYIKVEAFSPIYSLLNVGHGIGGSRYIKN